jgi:hypothetical protein
VKIFFLLMVLVGYQAFCEPVCENIFEGDVTKEVTLFPSGRNQALGAVMQKAMEYENSMLEFARSIADVEQRTPENLAQAREVVQKYQKLFQHVIENSGEVHGRMMSAKIDSIEPAKRAAFVQMYQNFYLKYSMRIDEFALLLQMLSQMPPSEWTNDRLLEILREMNTAQAEAHLRS